MRAKHYVLAAGGTGGHMVPAAALATELTKRGHRVALVSDARGVRFPELFDGVQTHVLPAGRFQAKRPLGWLPAAREMWRGRAMARELYATFKPAAVIGFGGYPAFPALLAAFADDIPTAVHEQNAVLGRVNRLVARRVDAIATSYDTTERLPAKLAGKVHVVGNPVRAAVLALRAKAFPLLEEDGIFRVLVTGGSQGASVLSQVVPDGLAMLPVGFRRRLQVTHQARIEDIDAVRAKYAKHGIPADIATYLPDMPEQLAWAHLVIARAGASTIAELTVAGRPAILVPLPSATDDHQTANAREIVVAGGARVIHETRLSFDQIQDADVVKAGDEGRHTTGRFTASELCRQMQKLGLDPAALENAAGRAKSVGKPNAVSDLADLVESLDAPVSRLPVAVPQKPREAFA